MNADAAGATGAGTERFALIGCLVFYRLYHLSPRSVFAVSPCHIGSHQRIARGAAIAPDPRRLVDRQLVWLGFSACSSCRDKPGHDDKLKVTTDALQLLPVHFFVPADHPRRLFRAGSGSIIWLPVIWLALASLVFYSVSNWQFVLLLLASVAFNYVIGGLLISKRLRPASRFAALTIGVAGRSPHARLFQVCRIFLPPNLNAVFSTGFTVDVLLPVGISFYTFTQIAFLVDAYRGNVARYAFAALCAVRHLFSASDRGAHPSPQGHDPPVRGARPQDCRIRI